MADTTPSTPYGAPYFSSVKADNIDPQSNIGAGEDAVPLQDVAGLVKNVGSAGGVAQLDNQAQLLLQGKSALGVVSATSGTADTPATPAMLLALIPLHGGTAVGTDGTTLETLVATATKALQKSAALQPGGYVPMTEANAAAFTANGMVIPQQGGDDANPVYVDYSANSRELTIHSFSPGCNILCIKNTSPDGWAATTFQGLDTDANDYPFEHGAIGYGPSLPLGESTGFMFVETSSVDGNRNPKLRAVPFVLQQTGGHFSSYQEAQVVLTGGATTITTTDGSNFPSGVNGQLITCTSHPYALRRATTIVSGEGTNTLTLSNALLASSSDTEFGDLVRFGPTDFTQTNYFIAQSCGNIDFYTFAASHDGKITAPPFMSLDRVAGRVGINCTTPKTGLHVVGQALFSTTKTFDQYSLRFNAAVPINVVPGGDVTGNYGATGENTLFYIYGIGKNALLANWNSDNQIEFVDVNGNESILTIDMDMSGCFTFKKMLGLPSLTKAQILAVPKVRDGLTVMCSDLGVPVVYSEANAGWFPLSVGTKLSA